MKFWFDTEFMEDGRTIELLSIGIVAEDGRELYLESAEADYKHANEFVFHNVLPQLQRQDAECRYPPRPIPECVKHRKTIAANIINFVGEKPEFWAYYADYDWVVLCQLFGTMMDLPKGWPMFCMDLKQYAVSLGNPRLPDHTLHQPEHNALSDARWTKDAHHFLVAMHSKPGDRERTGIMD